MHAPLFREILFSDENIDLYHIRYDDMILNICDKQKKILIFSTMIGVLTFFTLGAGGVISARLFSAYYKKQKIQEVIEEIKVEEEEENFDEASYKKLKVNFMPRPLIEQGGIQNGGNTSCLASSLQCLKNVPCLVKYLEKNINPRISGIISSEDYNNLRMIREKILEIIIFSLKGEEVSATQINDLRSLLCQIHQMSLPIDQLQRSWICKDGGHSGIYDEEGRIDFSPNLSNPQEKVWTLLRRAIGLPIIMFTTQDSEQFQFDIMYCLFENVTAQNEEFLFNDEYLLFVAQSLAVNAADFIHKNELISLKVIKNQIEKNVTYRLSGIAYEYEGHTQALLKGQDEVWVNFNDAKVISIHDLDYLNNKNLFLYYAKIA